MRRESGQPERAPAEPVDPSTPRIFPERFRHSAASSMAKPPPALAVARELQEILAGGRIPPWRFEIALAGILKKWLALKSIPAVKSRRFHRTL